jgi:NAD(P)-dependent dehydrogenase (short-subunit alcohol dehydrogenase family)
MERKGSGVASNLTLIVGRSWDVISYRSVSFAALDVTDKVATKAFLDKFINEHGRIDYCKLTAVVPSQRWEKALTYSPTVFPNAGVPEVQFIPNSRLDTYNKDRFMEPNLTTLEVDLVAPIYSSGLVIQQMRKQEKNSTGFRGKIVCTSSIL